MEVQLRPAQCAADVGGVRVDAVVVFRRLPLRPAGGALRVRHLARGQAHAAVVPPAKTDVGDELRRAGFSEQLARFFADAFHTDDLRANAGGAGAPAGQRAMADVVAQGDAHRAASVAAGLRGLLRSRRANGRRGRIARRGCCGFGARCGFSVRRGACVGAFRWRRRLARLWHAVRHAKLQHHRAGGAKHASVIVPFGHLVGAQLAFQPIQQRGVARFHTFAQPHAGARIQHAQRSHYRQRAAQILVHRCSLSSGRRECCAGQRAPLYRALRADCVAGGSKRLRRVLRRSRRRAVTAPG